jgi:hypothetical protein
MVANLATSRITKKKITGLVDPENFTFGGNVNNRQPFKF